MAFDTSLALSIQAARTIDVGRGNGGGSAPIGNGYTISGTGFGAKTGTPTFDDFESLPVGAAGNNLGNLQISNIQGSTISNVNFYAGTRGYAQDYSLQSFPKIYKDITGLSPRHYMSCWFKWEGTVSGFTVWKFGRIGAGDAYSGNPKAGESYTGSDSNQPGGFGGEIVSSNGVVGSGQNATLADVSTIYTPNTWHFYELEFYAGTVDGNNSYFVVRCDNKETVVWNSIEFLTTANSALPAWILTPINGLDNGPNINMYMDQVYIDESRARVVMTDNAVYANSTKWAVQPIASYSDSSVEVAGKRQGFAVGATAYLHLFNESGALVSEGNQITVLEN